MTVQANMAAFGRDSFKVVVNQTAGSFGKDKEQQREKTIG